MRHVILCVGLSLASFAVSSAEPAAQPNKNEDAARKTDASKAGVSLIGVRRAVISERSAGMFIYS